MSLHEVFSNSQNDASTIGTNRPPPYQRASYLFCQEQGLTMVNRGASGAMTQDQSYAGYNLPARAADTRVWLLDVLTNDMYFRPQTAVGKQWTKDFMTACLSHALFGVKKTAISGAVSTVGAWSNTPVDALGMLTKVAGAKKTFEVAGEAVSVCWLADYHVASQGVFEIRIDGNLVDTVNIYIPFGNTRNGLRWGHAARIYAVEDGAHTVEVTSIANGTSAYLSYVAGSGDQPTMPKCYLGTGTKCATVPDAYSGECRQMVLDHVAFLSGLGLPVKAVDTWAAIAPYAHMMPDGIHWNAAGQVAVRDAMIAAAAEPQVLSWPISGGGTLVVNLDASGAVTSYGVEP